MAFATTVFVEVKSEVSAAESVFLKFALAARQWMDSAKLLLTRCLPQILKPQMVETTISMDAVFGRVAELCASTIIPLVISPMVFCAASEHGTTGC